MKKMKMYFEQKYFEYFDKLFFNEFFKAIDKVQDIQEDREGRILSLAKEKNSRLLSKLDDPDSVIWLTMASKITELRALQKNEISLEHDVSSIERYFRSLIESLVFTPLQQGDYESHLEAESISILTLINTLIGEELNITHVPFATYRNYFGYSKAYNDASVALVESSDGKNFITLLNKSHPKNRKNTLFKDGTCVCDIAKYLTYKWCYRQVNLALSNAFKDNDVTLFNDYVSLLSYKESLFLSKPYMVDYTKEELFEAIIRSLLGREFSLEILENSEPDKITMYYSEDINEDSLNLLKLVGFNVLPVPEIAIKQFRTQARFLRNINEAFRENFKGRTSLNYLEIGLAHNIYVPNPFFFKKEISLASEKRGRYSEHEWVLPPMNHDVATLLYSISTKKVSEALFVEHFKKQANDTRAKSYMTMKNHLKSCEDFMKNSELGISYFGFLEVDDDCDIQKTEVVANEIMTFIDSYIPFAKELLSANSIRFRKLGNHKASGLYYPYIHCLCVDMRTVSSFIHELGHLLDYGYDSLSTQYSFQKLYRKYCEELNKTKGSVKLSGKYDLSYYQEPTEVFARCFEMYCFKVLEVENSLLKTAEAYKGFAYSIENEELSALVKEYFDTFFCQNMAVA